MNSWWNSSTHCSMGTQRSISKTNDGVQPWSESELRSGWKISTVLWSLDWRKRERKIIPTLPPPIPNTHNFFNQKWNIKDLIGYCSFSKCYGGWKLYIVEDWWIIFPPFPIFTEKIIEHHGGRCGLCVIFSDLIHLAMYSWEKKRGRDFHICWMFSKISSQGHLARNWRLDPRIKIPPSHRGGSNWFRALSNICVQ